MIKRLVLGLCAFSVLGLSPYIEASRLDVFDEPFDDPFSGTESRRREKLIPTVPYSYQPTNPEFWTRFQTMLGDEKTKDQLIFNHVSRNFAQTDEGSPAQLETLIALGQFFERQSLHYGAYLIYAQAAESLIGSSVSELALYRMSRLLSRHPMDDLEVERFVNRREYVSLHPQVQSFVSYYTYRHNKRRGLTEWAQDQRKLIAQDTHWGQLITYWDALALIQEDQPAKARSLLTELNEEEGLELWLRNSTRLQLARLHFEEGKWKEANSLYYALDHLPLREQGRVLLERAWSLYYQKDYASSLGALKALENPYFEPSVHFEKYILEMIIYRELCHYESVQQTATLFSFRFGNSLEQIRRRRPLRLDRTLFNMATMSQDLQPRANLIHQIRQEEGSLRESPWASHLASQMVLSTYHQRDQFLQESLSEEVESRARQVALQLLDANEQILFIEYISSIESFRANQRQPASRAYSLQAIPRTRFESIFWPVHNEFWWDELSDYTALISNRCEELSP